MKTYGFCFGAKKLAQAAAAGEHLHLFSAVALVHPTNLAPEDGGLFTVPVALIPSGGEDPEVMNGVWERLMKKEFKGKCVRKDFVSARRLGKDVGWVADAGTAGLPSWVCECEVGLGGSAACWEGEGGYG